MPKMKYYNGSAWVTLDANDTDTLDGKHASEFTWNKLYTTTNSTNDYSIATTDVTSYTDGLTIKFKANADSTGSTTLNVNSKGAKSILKANGGNVTNLKTNGVYTVVYSNGNFILQGEGASGNALASDLLSGKTATTDAGEIIGTLLLGKKSANGTASAVSCTSGIGDKSYCNYNGGSTSSGSMTIYRSNAISLGLDFTPSYLFIKDNNGYWMEVSPYSGVKGGASSSNGAYFTNITMSTFYSSGSLYYMRAGSSGTNLTVTWYAIE